MNKSIRSVGLAAVLAATTLASGCAVRLGSDHCGVGFGMTADFSGCCHRDGCYEQCQPCQEYQGCQPMCSPCSPCGEGYQGQPGQPQYEGQGAERVVTPAPGPTYTPAAPAPNPGPAHGNNAN